MELVIKKLTADLLKDINKANDEFIINEKLIPLYENGRLSYTVVKVPEYRKKYQPETPEFYASHISNPDKAGFIAYLDGRVAGQLFLHRNWNRFAWIDDIGVDIQLRRQGIGRALMSHAEEWARKNGFPGIMLETQDTNVKACRFYESNGFVLGGLDTHLYHAADRYREEIALFWYLVF
jgi:streptothricin acetyltransferase